MLRFHGKIKIKQMYNNMYLSATGMSAFVRFVAGVCTDVLLQMRQLCKLALTNFTPEK